VVVAPPGAFSSLLATAWGLTGGAAAPAGGCTGGHEHNHDCVVPHAAARLPSPRAALKQLDDLEPRGIPFTVA
jgi:hypothetical protein